ncbi:MAG TPA: hypothetical protein VF310_04155 [Vicinamibacteria bacterium]
MRRNTMILVSLLAVGLVAGAQAQSKDKGEGFVGSWTGSWTGGSDGTLEFTITKDKDGKLGGSITPSPASGDTFTASFKTVAIDDGKLTATFETPDGGAEATLTGGLDAGAAKGAYNLKEKSQGQVVETGTWSAKKK